MNDYPLYYELLKRVAGKDDKTFNANEVCMTLNSISSMATKDQVEHYEELAALISKYELVENDGVLLSSIPYEGKKMPGDKNVLHNFIKFPLQLKYIIVEYINYYSN